jgi:hypothetical protein
VESCCRLDKDLTYRLEVECKVKKGDIENYEEVKGQIEDALAALRDSPERYVPLCCIVRARMTV